MGTKKCLTKTFNKMKKGEKINFTVNDNTVIEGVVIDVLDNQINGNNMQTTYLVYAQNRLVTILEDIINGYCQVGEYDFEQYYDESIYFNDVLCDYCIIPEYDKILKS